MKRKNKPNEKVKIDKPDSDMKLIIVLGSALILALLLIAAVMFTSSATIS
jgi:hypothetical protein